MKKIVSLLLAVALCVSLTTPALAAESTPVQKTVGVQNSKGETIGVVYNTPDVEIVVTYVEEDSGFATLYEYHNGVLIEMAQVMPGASCYNRAVISEATTRSGVVWERVDIASNTNDEATPYVVTRKTTRTLGSMHYVNSIMGQTYSIECEVDEWYLDEKEVEVQGTLGKIVEAAAFFAGVLGLPIAASTALVNSLIEAALLYVFEEILHAATMIEVTANVIEQRIYGECTSHSGKPIGDLGDAKIISVSSNSSKYPGETLYEGYHTDMWRTNELGSAMFWKVFGVEYTPTYWT